MGVVHVNITLHESEVTNAKVAHLIFIIVQNLTNEDHNIWDTTYEELNKLDLPTSLKYGKLNAFQNKYGQCFKTSFDYQAGREGRLLL